MGIFSIDNIICTIAGYNLSLLELLTTISGLCCVFLAARGKITNFWVGYIYTFLLFFLFLQIQYYSNMLLQPVSLIIAIYGHYRWSHPKQGEENKKRKLKVSTLSNSKRLYHIGLVILLTLVWGFALSKIDLFFNLFGIKVLPASRPYLDAFGTMMILTAQYLSAQKKLDCWGAWIMVNITNISLYIMAGRVFMPIVNAIYLMLALVGITTWYKEMKEEKVH